MSSHIISQNVKYGVCIIQLEQIPSKYQYKYTAILYSYLYSKKPVCCTGQHMHAKLSHSPSFIDKFFDYSSGIINIFFISCFGVLYHFIFVLIGSSKYGTTCKNIQQYYTETSNPDMYTTLKLCIYCCIPMANTTSVTYTYMYAQHMVRRLDVKPSNIKWPSCFVIGRIFYCI